MSIDGKINTSCQQWMTTFLPGFNPSVPKTYTFDRLYQDDVVSTPGETADMKSANKILRMEGIGGLPKEWMPHSGSIRSLALENPKYPGYIYKFCRAHPAAGNPPAHFFRVPKGKELKDIVQKDNLDELEIVDESLIALKSQKKIEEKSYYEQCHYFVVKSKKLNLLNEEETVAKLSSYDTDKQIKIATQIMHMICRSGLGDVGFHNFQINRDTGKLAIVDTEPLYGSLVLDVDVKREDQYADDENLRNKFKRYERLYHIKRYHTNQVTVCQGLEQMVKACDELPIFKKVAEAYWDAFVAQYPPPKP